MPDQNIIVGRLTFINVTAHGLVQFEFIDDDGHRHFKTYNGQSFIAALQQLGPADTAAKQEAGLRALDIAPDQHGNHWITQLDDGIIANLGHPGYGGASLHLLELLHSEVPYGRSLVWALQNGREESLLNTFLGLDGI